MSCRHPSKHVSPNGPRMPMRYGSAATDVCLECGAWRTDCHGKGKWRPAAMLLIKIAETTREDGT